MLVDDDDDDDRKRECKKGIEEDSLLPRLE